MLRHCCASPRTVETLLNCYARVPVTEAWQQAVPEELVRVSRPESPRHGAAPGGALLPPGLPPPAPFSPPPLLPSLQQHPRFFRSLFALGLGPRSLQHLARCALRNCLEGRLLQALPHLRLPPALEQFVLLRFEDLLY